MHSEMSQQGNKLSQPEHPSDSVCITSVESFVILHLKINSTLKDETVKYL